jgi:SHS2 domain-containing protein
MNVFFFSLYSTTFLPSIFDCWYILDLDHTADVQLHCWGSNLLEAFQNMAPCMLNYMTDINNVKIDPEESLEIIVQGTVFAPLYMSIVD